MDLSRLGSQLNFRSVSVGLSCPDLFCRVYRNAKSFLSKRVVVKLTVKSENQFAWSNSKENTFYQGVISTRIIGAWFNTPHRSIKAFPYFFCHCSQYHQQTKPKPQNPKKCPLFFKHVRFKGHEKKVSFSLSLSLITDSFHFHHYSVTSSSAPLFDIIVCGGSKRLKRIQIT